MAKSKSRSAVEDKILGGFNTSLKQSGSLDKTPVLSLAEQIRLSKQNQPVINFNVEKEEDEYFTKNHNNKIHVINRRFK
jgi:hypothetical protein